MTAPCSAAIRPTTISISTCCAKLRRNPSEVNAMIVDGLSMPVPERQWFEEWREAKIGCVNTSVAVWENSSETLAVLGKWRLVIEQNSDLVAAAASVAEIERVAASGRTAIVL